MHYHSKVLFKESNIFIQQGWIKPIKSESEEFYIDITFSNFK